MTIIVLLILAGISISMLSGDNGILQRATDAKIQTEKATIIESAKTDILSQIAENKGEDITDSQFKAILGKYFKEESIPNEIPEDLSDLNLTSINGGYTINGKEIYDGSVKKEELKSAILDLDKFNNRFNYEKLYTLEKNSYGSVNYSHQYRFSTFEKAESAPEQFLIEKNNFSTSESEEKIYVWFVEESKENIQTYNKQSSEEDEIVEFYNGKLYWYSKGKPTFKGNMRGFFAGYRGSNIDLSEWDMTEVTMMDGLFSSSKNLISVSLGNLSHSNVTSFCGMFDGCSSLKKFDLRGINTSRVTNVAGMFNYCTNLEEVYFNDCQFAENAVFGGCFRSCTKLELVDLSSVDMSTAKNIGEMFAGVTPTKIIAPINVKSGMGNTVALGGQYDGSDGNTYTGLPEGKTESITLTKK